MGDELPRRPRADGGQGRGRQAPARPPARDPEAAAAETRVGEGGGGVTREATGSAGVGGVAGGGGAGEVTAAAARGRWGSGEMGLVGLGPARPAPLVDLGFRTLAEGGNFSRGLPSAKVFYNFFLFSFSFLLLI